MITTQTSGQAAGEGRRPVSFRVEPETYRLLVALTKKLGLGKAAVFRLAVRKLAEQEGVR